MQKPVPAFQKKIFLDLAVDGSARAPMPALIVDESVLQNYLSFVVNRVLSYYVHQCHADPGNHCDAGKRDSKAIPVFNVLADEFPKEVQFS